MAKICAVIPAYNEEAHLGSVIEKTKKYTIDIIVIDDGSTDKTAAIAQDEGAHLIKHSSNEGKGKALRDGLQFALEREYDQIIILDADNQHNPNEIPLFVKKISSSGSGIIVGNRMHNPKDMPSRRVFINKLFSKIVSRVCKQNIPDALSGYRIIKKEVLKSISLTTNRFDTDPEILIRASKVGFKIDYINIKCIYAGEASQIRPLPDGYRFFRLIIRELKNYEKNSHSKS